MYHVASSKDIESIKKKGIITEGIPDYYSPRYELDQAIDIIGRQLHGSKWVSRVDGVYFWETRKQAINETQHTEIYNRLIKISRENISSTIWKLPHYEWEAVYQKADRPYKIDEDNEIWSDLQQLVKKAKIDDGVRTGKHELWTRKRVSPNAIEKIEEIDKT